MQEAFGDRMTTPDGLEGLVADDRKGRKNGRGFYLYEDGRKGGVDESVYAAIGVASHKAMDRELIQERVGLQFINEAARCLEEGILRSARDGDVGAIFGLGFPPFTGGPFSYVDTVGAKEIVAKLESLAEEHGSRFEPANILKEHAATGELFRA